MRSCNTFKQLISTCSINENDFFAWDKLNRNAAQKSLFIWSLGHGDPELFLYNKDYILEIQLCCLAEMGINGNTVLLHYLYGVMYFFE